MKTRRRLVATLSNRWLRDVKVTKSCGIPPCAARREVMVMIVFGHGWRRSKKTKVEGEDWRKREVVYISSRPDKALQTDGGDRGE